MIWARSGVDPGKIWNGLGKIWNGSAQAVFPYVEFSEGNVHKRTKESFELDTEKAINTGDPVE